MTALPLRLQSEESGWRLCGPFPKTSANPGLEHTAHMPFPSLSPPPTWRRGAGASRSGTTVFVPLGLRSGSWTSHHGVAGCGSLQKAKWPTSSWRTGPQVKAREACVGLRYHTSHFVKGGADGAWPSHSGNRGICPGDQSPGILVH